MNHINMTSTSCAGCKACFGVCSKNAISYSSDTKGFHIPVVNEDLCVNCGLCVRVCPALTPFTEFTNDEKTVAYAFQYHDDNVRKNSASGALFPAFAKYFIENLHGYVCGCVLDENIMPKHLVSNKWEDVVRMQDSKYVQSDMSECVCEIGELLKSDFHVLFTGTSCQVSGLKSYLRLKKINIDNLLTIDFFCHGVPSPMVWQDYIKLYEKNVGYKIEGFKFRNKTYGWGKGTQSRGTSFLSTWKYKGSYHENMALLSRMWPRIFFSNLCLRDYCHSCPYTNVDKPADVTMGDFWGVEEFYPNFDDHKGCSLVIVRNNKAGRIFKKIENVEILKVSIDEVIKKQGNAFAPSKPHPQKDFFWNDYMIGGIKFTLAKYLNYTYIGRSKAFIRYILYKLHLGKYYYW